MRLDEMYNKKLAAACNRLERRLKRFSFSYPTHTVDVKIIDNATVNVRVELNTYVSATDEDHFNEFSNQLDDVRAAIDSVLEPVSVVDNSHFGGQLEMKLIRRGKKIDADALLSDIEFLVKLPVNRYT